jgi:CRP-like cAMP-binding protein
MPNHKQHVSIASIPLFKNLPISDLIAILKITSSRLLEPGETLFSEKDKADGLYILLSGKLQVYIFSGFVGGKPKILAKIYPGQYVGEMGLFDKKTRSASVSAVTKSELIFLPSVGFAILLGSSKKIAQAVIDNLEDLTNPQSKVLASSLNTDKVGRIKLEPSLANMQKLCGVLREQNLKTAIKSR